MKKGDLIRTKDVLINRMDEVVGQLGIVCEIEEIVSKGNTWYYVYLPVEKKKYKYLRFEIELVSKS